MTTTEPQGRHSASDHWATGREVLETEAAAVHRVATTIDPATFGQAVEAMLRCEGQVIVSGVGKPWFLAQKISATLASTGTPSVALHPSDAVHGDVGRVRPGDVVLLLSHSGESDEVTRLLPILGQLGATRIALTATAENTLAQGCEIVVAIGRIEEACPLRLAPSASSTAMLAVGDALALAVLQARGFTREDYARYHPGGALGRKLMHVRDLLRPLDRSAVVAPSTPVREVIAAITRTRCGAALVANADGTLAGIFTDGDLRRHLSQRPDVVDDPVADHMTATPRTIGPDRLVGDALRMMREHRIDELPVVDTAGQLQGHLDVQDLLAIGLAID